MNKQRWFIAAFVVAMLAIVVVGAISWVGSERALRPGYRTYPQSLRDFPDLLPQPVTITTTGSVQLKGEFFPGNRKAVIILAHGYGDTEQQMLPYAEFLHRDDFPVLAYNMRGRTPSGGTFVTLGAMEEQDLRSVVSYVQTKFSQDPIGVLGVSMGGATAILAAARDQRIRAVVDDCGFSDAPSVIATSFEHFIHLPAFPFALFTTLIASARADINVTGIRPMDVAGRIAPRPIFMIHGLDDDVVPPIHTQRNFKAAHDPKELWLVPHATHAKAHTAAKEEYERRVDQFFEKALLTER